MSFLAAKRISRHMIDSRGRDSFIRSALDGDWMLVSLRSHELFSYMYSTANQCAAEKNHLDCPALGTSNHFSVDSEPRRNQSSINS